MIHVIVDHSLFFLFENILKLGYSIINCDSVPKKITLDLIDVLVYGSLIGIVIWFVLKVTGVFETSLLIRWTPLILGVIAFFGIYNKTERIDEKISGGPTIEYRKLTKTKARKEIEKYLKDKKKKVWIEDVVNDLNIEPEIVIKVIKELEKEGKIK